MIIEVALVGLCAIFAGGLWAIWARVGQLGDRLDGRIDRLDGRFDRLDGRIDRLEGRIDGLEERINQRINVLAERVARIEGMLTAVLPTPEPSPH